MQRRLHIILFFLFLSTYTYGQDINYGVWTQAGVSFDIAKDLKASVSEMYRQDLQTPIRRAYITELGLKYDLSKKWSVAGEYRLKLLPSEYRNRIALSANFREGMGIFDLYVRSKLQYEWRQYGSPESAWRNRFKMRFDYFKDVKPYVSYELFINKNNEEINLTTYRGSVGVDWELNKHNAFDIYIITDQEIYEASPTLDLIFGVSYEYKFK
ncbi:MAG: DUF2490 domain-containing protein [Bacteroidetes bacterium]|nr:DUF2490 domain-containing protein [Bacteroidota bacterium]MBP8752978.1 DUF2490 domain-containing protein [Chitinophagales bacterium]MBK7109809.1 DUF2490 domain-containing protein [Bacteroidota bacterium]MBK8487454.1 DUF2490 domain-containing protein [Bacteroidota bacterium]MBK8682803.1 DUF2490 domain-containing protein [Bacteroidota bacterium]